MREGEGRRGATESQWDCGRDLEIKRKGENRESERKRGKDKDRKAMERGVSKKRWREASDREKENERIS